MRSLLMILLTAPLAAAQTAPPKVETGKPVHLRFAGVKLGLPVGYKHMQSDSIDLVLHARKVVEEKPVVALRLVAWRLPVGTATAAFAKIKHPSAEIAYTNLTVLADKPIHLGDAKGNVQVMTYDLRGEAMKGLWMFFYRALGKEQGHMAYLLKIESHLEQAGELLPALIAVAKTIELSDPQRPIDAKIGPLATDSISSEWFGYAVRPPAMWKAREIKGKTAASIPIVQYDYTIKQAMPRAEFRAVPMTKGPRAITDEILEGLRKDPKRKGKVKVLHRGDVQWGRHRAHEFIIQVEGPGKEGEAKLKALIGRRTASAAGRSYSLEMGWDNDKLDDFKAAWKTLTSGIRITAPPDPATQPAATTAPATQPAATTAPATQPAGK